MRGSTAFRKKKREKEKTRLLSKENNRNSDQSNYTSGDGAVEKNNERNSEKRQRDSGKNRRRCRACSMQEHSQSGPEQKQCLKTNTQHVKGQGKGRGTKHLKRRSRNECAIFYDAKQNVNIWEK